MFKWFRGLMPDITPAQIVSGTTFIVTQAVAWGWMNNDTGQRFVSVVGTVVPAIWMFVDAQIRSARNKRLAVEAAAKLQ